jgi:DNA-binding MarR family transcriptional regulator
MKSIGSIQAIRQVLERMRDVDENITVGAVIAFLTVAEWENRSLREYSEILGVPQSTMSRQLLDIGIMRRDRSPGMGLIDQRSDPDDLRKNTYCLTPRGKTLLKSLQRELEG